MKIVLLANTDWYLYNFLFPLADKLRNAGHEVVLVSPPGKYSGLLVSMGFRHVPLTFSRSGVNPFSEIMVIRRLHAIYRREQPDLLHHFTIKCVLYGSIAARLASLSSVVNTVPGRGHVFVDKGWRPRILRPLVKMMYRVALRTTHIIFMNPNDRDLFLNNGLAYPESIHVICGSGVDTSRYSPCGRASNTDEVQVLFAGRLLWSKGVGEYVEAARLAQESMPGLRFVAAGEPDPGNPACISDEVLRSWKKEGIVQFIGQCDDMRSLIANTDIAVLPSYGEGLARFLLEAASSGLPLVASNVSGCREIVRDGVNGYLVPVREAPSLAHAILKLARNRELRVAMGAESRRMVCAEFSKEEILRQIMDVYFLTLKDEKRSEFESELSFTKPESNIASKL